MGLTIFHGIFLDISHIQFECGEYLGIFWGILSNPQSIGMDLNIVMYDEKSTCKIYTENGKNQLIWPEWVAWNLSTFFRDGVREMMTNASCFINLFLLVKYLQIFKDASKSNPYLYTRVFLIRASKYPTLYMNAHKRLTQWHPKATASGVKHHLSGQSLHPTYHSILFGPPLLLLAFSGLNKNLFTPS